MEKQKKAKLDKLTSLFEPDRKLVIRNRSLAEAKQRVIQCDPQINISGLLQGVNHRNNKEALIEFMCENFLTPLIIRLLSKKIRENS